MRIIITPIFIILAALAKAIMDTLQFHFEDSVFSEMGKWWNPELSWKLKWAACCLGEKESFPFSSTLFVSVTDAWHMFQSIEITLIFLALVFYRNFFKKWWQDFILFRIIFTGSFQLFFYLFTN